MRASETDHTEGRGEERVEGHWEGSSEFLGPLLRLPRTRDGEPDWTPLLSVRVSVPGTTV